MSVAYYTARLERDYPYLAMQVAEGTLTAHRAAVIAGLKRRYLQVPADDVDDAVARLVRHYGIGEVDKAILRLDGPQ